MSFLLACPNCGPRDVYEFRFGGEAQKRPGPDAGREPWIEYLYFRTNDAGPQTEWWYHRMGCRTWFLAVRDTRTNQVREVRRPEDKPA
jgi:sarcosine oxidase subunit delta